MPTERRIDPSPDRRRAPRGGRRKTDTGGRHPPVLVADSDADARRPCVRYLTLFGFQVGEATNGDEAVRAIETLRPHAILAELTLPSASRLRKILAEDFRVPVIVTTTNDARLIPADAAAFLMKPFSLATMLTELRRVLGAVRRAADGVLGVEPPAPPRGSDGQS